MSLATKAMFNNHFYKFGGRSYHQAQGGPIGLRGTCAGKVSHDRVWLGRIARAALPPIRAGWRWQEGSLVYCKRWEPEDKTLSVEQRTREI